MLNTTQTPTPNKQYRSRTQVHRPPSYVHDRTRIAKVRADFTILMKECAVLGPTKAQVLNPKYSLSTVKRRYRLWKEEEKKGTPLNERYSTYYANSDRHWNRTFTPEEEKKIGDNIHAIDSRVELINLPKVREDVLDYHQLLNGKNRSTRSKGSQPFKASNGFIKRFKIRQNFKRRKPKIVKKIKTYKSDAGMEKKMQNFQKRS